MRTRTMALCIAAAVLVAAGPARAQTRSNTSKFFAALELGGGRIESDDLDGSETGGGGTLRIGYGFTPLFSLYLEGTGATIDADGGQWTLSHGDLGVRLHFGNETRALIPFLDAAFTYRTITRDDLTIEDDEGNTLEGDFEIRGGAFSLGGGLLYFFNPKWALSTGLKWTTGEFDTVEFNNVSVSGFEIDATSLRLNIGVSWFPQLRR
jgi:hypothetical protein